MLYKEIITVCCHIHTKHINTLCGQNVGFLLVQKVVRIVTTVLYRHQQKPVAVRKAEPLHIKAASSSACSSTKNRTPRKMLLSCYNANTTPAVIHAGGVDGRTDGRMEIVLFFF